jgi:hypothetical protein
MAMDFGMTGVAPAPPMSAAGQGLGDLLGMQQKDETDEQRRKRLAGTTGDQPGTSEAVKSLFGSLGGLGSSLGASLGGRGRMGI